MTKTELRQIAANVAPTNFLTATEFLDAVYQAVKARVANYSYIRFTEDLGFGACNALYLIIHGQRPLTTKGAQKIVAALALKGVGRRYFLELVRAHRGGDAGEREAAFSRVVALKTRALPKTLDQRQLAFFNHWYNAAIVELLSLPAASDDPDWLASHLMPPVPPKTVAKSLVLLKKLGHVVFDQKRQRLVPSEQQISTGSEVVGLAVLRYHQQMIALANNALTDIAPLERDVSAVTIAIPTERVAELKEKIQEFRRELLTLSKDAENADQVAQINIQMFPLGRIASRSKRHEPK